MEISQLAQIAAFIVFSFIAIAGGLGMTTTMSMFRSGIFLMASFIGVAGLFILLMADLLGMLQIMMYIGGMLVMILFMVLFSSDPGGRMMAEEMDLFGLERFFSLGVVRDSRDQEDRDEGDGDTKAAAEEEGSEEQQMSPGRGGSHSAEDDHGGGDHSGMESMFTPIKKAAAVIAGVLCSLLILLILFRPAWPNVHQIPDQDSSRRIGQLLMGKYMIAFEGAGMLILLGIFGAVYLARVMNRGSESQERNVIQAASFEAPSRIEEEGLTPVLGLWAADRGGAGGESEDPPVALDRKEES